MRLYLTRYVQIDHHSHLWAQAGWFKGNEPCLFKLCILEEVGENAFTFFDLQILKFEIGIGLGVEE
jgi:hypothetical protein